MEHIDLQECPWTLLNLQLQTISIKIGVSGWMSVEWWTNKVEKWKLEGFTKFMTKKCQYFLVNKEQVSYMICSFTLPSSLNLVWLIEITYKQCSSLQLWIRKDIIDTLSEEMELITFKLWTMRFQWTHISNFQYGV